MTHRWVNEQIEEYRSRLPPNDLSDFDFLLNKRIDDIDLSEIKDELISHYENSEDHLELVIQSSSGFDQGPVAQGSQSGYEFAFTEPLEELNHMGEEGVKNGDVLLVKERDDSVCICIIECKSGRSSGNDWIRELRDIENTVQEYSDVLLNQIGLENKEIVHEQYVLLGKLIHMHGWNFDSWKERENISEDFVFWGYSFDEMMMVEVWGQSRDPDLASVINDGIDTGLVENPIEFTFGDHSLTKLKIIISSMIRSKKRSGDPEPFEFTRSEFYDVIESKLQVGFDGEPYEEFINDEIDWLLKLGKKINIFSDDGEIIKSNRDFRIRFRGGKATIAENVAEKKYFDEMAKEKRKTRAFQQVLDEFSPSQSRLTQFDGAEKGHDIEFRY